MSRLLVPAYALGSIELQAAFQHGDALTAAGMATLTTNAVPIAAGVCSCGRASLPASRERCRCRLRQLVAAPRC